MLVFATRRDLLPTQSQVLKPISTWRLPWGIWDTGRGMSRYKSDSGILLMQVVHTTTQPPNSALHAL